MAIDIEKPPVYLTARELAARWRMHPESLRRMAREGRIESLSIHGRRLFLLTVIERSEAEGRFIIPPPTT